MNRNHFRNISLVTVASLTLLAAVQCMAAWRIYRDAAERFERRAESAAYKSVYETVRTDPAFGGEGSPEGVRIDIDDFELYFTANLLEADALRPHCTEVVDRHSGRVVMKRGDAAALSHPMTAEIDLDDTGYFMLRISVSVPVDELWGGTRGIILSSAAIVVLLCCVFVYLMRTMFRQKSLDEMRRDLTHNITHELKTPIAVACAANDALRNFPAGADPARRTRYLDIVAAQLASLSSMVERILAVSVTEDGGAELKRERVELKPLLDDIASKYVAEGGKRVDVSVDVEDGLAVVADRFHLGNAVSTIVDNSVKYSGAEVHVGISARRTSEGVRISVRDDGIGIDGRLLERIFDKFYRVSEGDVQNTRGYGLGLYYARRVAERHGGRIEARSRTGAGTTITITLPYDER